VFILTYGVHCFSLSEVREEFQQRGKEGMGGDGLGEEKEGMSRRMGGMME